MKYTSIIVFFFISLYLKAQDTANTNCKQYIQNYYSDFKTGYNMDGRYIVLSENYNATFSDTTFTLTFDTIDENKNLQKQTRTINLKDVISIEPNGIDVVEIIDYETYAIPICWKLAFLTANESYNINIYYEVDDDMEQTVIYKAFETIHKSHQKN